MTLGTMSLLALLIAFLVPFPGTLFNKTVEATYEEIRGWIGVLLRRWNGFLDTVMRGPLAPVRHGVGGMAGGRFGVLLFLALSALVYGFLSPTFGFNAESVALFLGLLAGLALITVAFDLPLRLYHGRTTKAHDRGVLRALWWTLLIAVVCVAMSRLANFQPGYLYGLIIGFFFAVGVDQKQEGRAQAIATASSLAAAFIAWVLLAFLRAGTGSTDALTTNLIGAATVTIVVAGLENAVFAMLPLRFMPGSAVFDWDRRVWAVLIGLGIFGFAHVLLNPSAGYMADTTRTSFFTMVALLAFFALASVAFWAYFRFRPARGSAGQAS